MLRFWVLLFLQFFGLLSAAGWAEDAPPSPRPVPWKAGENLVFEINWGLVNAGESSLEVREIADLVVSTATQRTVKAYHFVATARSNSFVDVFFKVRDKNEAYLDIHSWVTHRFEQHNQEGKYILDQFVDYDWDAKRFRNLEKVQGRQPKYEEGALTVPAVDTLSSLYVVRARPLKVGDEFTLDVHSGQNWPLLVKVLKRETVKVPAGKFDCFLVEPFLRERGIFIQKGKKLQVWLTADERQLPVQMKAEVFIGKVSAVLKEIR